MNKGPRFTPHKPDPNGRNWYIWDHRRKKAMTNQAFGTKEQVEKYIKKVLEKRWTWDTQF